MRITNATWIAAALVAAAYAVALWAWTTLPAGAGVATDYLGLDGVRHHGVSRAVLWLIPAIAGFVVTVMTFAPGFGAADEVERGAEVFDTTLIAVAGLLLVVEAALVGRAMDPGFNVLRPVTIATGVLLLVIGNYLGKARQNLFIGLKTPWTLANATVWDKTQRFTGRGLVMGGLALVILGFALRETALLGAAIGLCAAAPILAGIARSRSLYRGLQRT
ncbi:MAG TPA: SdpI family protein [Phenylobacterium sp.]|jgi:hypothetical protein|uniref:SdpI family protein n=1 Tax=Phenylobacterium sp. TaxID=1871053 RepID=UPI002D5BAFA5|nr:SdpI family protein [Phenylobacterium sp.]HZZ66636.1 SdpI family protein [Phenylobacterium sp.]